MTALDAWRLLPSQSFRTNSFLLAYNPCDMFGSDKLIWWQEPNSVRIPLGILLAIAWYSRLRTVYFGIKNTPKRPPRVRGIEVRVAIGLWTFILVAVTVLFITHR